MAFDGIFTRCITDELNTMFAGAKINKIVSHTYDEIIFSMHKNKKKINLFISCNNESARIHATDDIPENSKKPFAFCTVLRKHVQGANIVKIKQKGFERIVEIHLEAKDQMGFVTQKILIVEIMGKHSNIVLTEPRNDKLYTVDSVKHIEPQKFSCREVLQGIPYSYPPLQNKIPLPTFSSRNGIALIKALLKEDSAFLSSFSTSLQDEEIDSANLLKHEDIEDNFSKTNKISFSDRFFLNNIGGISPTVSKWLATSKTEFTFASALLNVSAALASHSYAGVLDTPKIYFSANTREKPLDFHIINFTGAAEDVGSSNEIPSSNETPGISLQAKDYPSISSCVEDFYVLRGNAGENKRLKTELSKLCSSKISKLSAKMNVLQGELDEALQNEKYKLYANVLSSHLHELKQGQRNVTLLDYNSEEEITITLDTTLSPAQNMQKYYSLYAKSKTAAIEKQKQINLAKMQVEFLENTLSFISLAESLAELERIKEDLIAANYYKAKQTGAKKKRPQKSSISPATFVDENGNKLFVGRNSKENEYIVSKVGEKNDIWFHSKDIPGSHVLLKCSSPSDDLIASVASIAAYYSKARESENVPVDYLKKKYLKKPNGAPPGFVIFTHNKTIYSSPNPPNEFGFEKI